MQGKSSPLDREQRINRLAARQYGQVSRAQLLRLGLGPGAIEHRVKIGRLISSRRGVYSVGVSPPSRGRRWAAALLACGPGAVLGHLSAAALWELRTVDPVKIDVSVPRRNARSREGIRVHRPRHLDSQDVTRHRGIPVTTVPRTLIDLAEVLSTRSLERTVDEAEFLKRLDITAVRACVERHRGRNGAARLAKVLARHQPGSTRTRTELEENFYVLVTTAGLPQPEVNVPLGPFTVDFLWPESNLVVETDGGASHNRATQREEDARRDAWLAARHYQTLRFTWGQVHYCPAEVLAALEAKLAR